MSADITQTNRFVHPLFLMLFCLDINYFRHTFGDLELNGPIQLGCELCSDIYFFFVSCKMSVNEF